MPPGMWPNTGDSGPVLIFLSKGIKQMKCECGEEIESIAHLKGHRQYCEKSLVPTKSEVQQLRDDLAKAHLQIQEHQNKAAEWVEYVFENNTEAKFKTGYMRGFVQGLAEAFRQGLHLKQTEKRNDPKGCICGPEGKCDYHNVSDVTVPRCHCAAVRNTDAEDVLCPVHG